MATLLRHKSLQSELICCKNTDFNKLLHEMTMQCGLSQRHITVQGMGLSGLIKISQGKWISRLMGLTLLLLSPLALAQSARQSTLFFGHDDRVHIPPNQPPWNTVGQIETMSGSICTATLINPNTLISAAHCMIGSDRQLDVIKQFNWQLDGKHHIPLAVSRVWFSHDLLKALIPDGEGWIIPPQSGAQDIAVIRLKQSISADIAFPKVFEGSISDLKVALQSQHMQVSQGGYPDDHQDRLMVHERCKVTRISGKGMIEHQCDTLEGDSGSPLFLTIDNQVWLIGIQSSAPDAQHRQQADNMAVSTTAIPRWLKNKWLPKSP